MDNELLVVEASLLIVGLFARFGRSVGLPTIPFSIVAGIAFGPHTPGLRARQEPDEPYRFALIGLVVLLFHLGIEFSLDDPLAGGR